MGKVRLFLFLLLSAGVQAGDAPKFLSYLEFGREAGFRLADARAEYLIALETEQKEQKILEMYQKLRERNAISEEELRIALRTRDVSVARTRVWRDRIAALEGSVAHSKRNAEMARTDVAAQSEIDALYADYLLQWKSQCAVFKSEVDLYAAEYALADYRLGNARVLRNKSAVSLQELLEREVEFKFADEKLKKSREIHATCMDGVPTLDEIRKIAAPTPKP